jgi:uncharacterized protein YndB with AHSA1/START domain
MFTVSTSCLIQAPPDAVFHAFTDLENAPRHIPAIKNIQILHGPAQMAKGTRWKETRVMFGKEATEIMEITEIEPPRFYAAEASSHGCLYRTTFRFTPEGSGTRIDTSFTGIPQSMGAKVAGALTGWMMKKMVRKCLDTDVGSLKDVLERQEVASGASKKTAPATV